MNKDYMRILIRLVKFNFTIYFKMPFVFDISTATESHQISKKKINTDVQTNYKFYGYKSIFIEQNYLITYSCILKKKIFNGVFQFL